MKSIILSETVTNKNFNDRGYLLANSDYEIVDYVTTDILGIGEVLPFKNGTFDAVISIALEPVKDPFKCASESSRALKKGSTLVSHIPFYSPIYHRYPQHYYNMTFQGHENLYSGIKK